MSARPSTSRTTDRWYDGLGPAMRRGDDDEWLLLKLVKVLGDRLAPVDELVSDRPGYPGWSLAGDLNRTPFVGALGMFVGVRYRGDLTEAENRQRIRDRPESRRGTPGYIRAVAREHLIGGKRVELYERDGGHHRHVRIRVFAADLADDETRLQAALKRALPWRYKLTLDVAVGWTVDQLTANVATVDDLTAMFDTVDEVTYHQLEE